MQIKCPRCGQIQPIDVSFCANCGLARPVTNTPRQSTADSIVKPFTDWFTALGLIKQSLLIGGIIVFFTLLGGGILIAGKKEKEAKLLAQANATPAPTATIAPPAPTPVPLTADELLLGDKPSDGKLRLAFNNYLRNRLNDYDSSEYVNYTSAIQVSVKGQPYWLSHLRLRAKNGFGGYILRDVQMYIRKNEVVFAEGL